MYPRVTVELDKLGNNVQQMIRLCGEYGIDIMGVTKVFGGALPIASVLVANGLKRLGDSRLENIKNYSILNCEKWLIRMPSISEAKDTVRYCDVSLNSEKRTLEALEKAAAQLHKNHKVVLMVDLGDLREGYLNEKELAESVSFVRQAKHLTLYGLGTNLTCFSFVQPDTEKLQHLLDLAEKYNATACISGGNSATIHLMMNGGIPKGINTLRLGESILFGRERAKYQYLPDMYNDAFLFETEIIECKEKPTMPIGTIGQNSYGQTPTFEDKGNRIRAICAAGRQDIDTETMWPMDDGIEIIGASSDHLIVDITDAKREYKVGNRIKFRLGYFSTMRVFTSQYVERNYVLRKNETLRKIG
ncbi:MAG: alanine/ornithine racemase family PLP-dependent enzyme [Lachnospiraceae bacterium]|nr:alanine/ornithine racemase family PLP-dependent enzyme [Lachnospiraceae bacterium]